MLRVLCCDGVQLSTNIQICRLLYNNSQSKAAITEATNGNGVHFFLIQLGSLPLALNIQRVSQKHTERLLPESAMPMSMSDQQF